MSVSKTKTLKLGIALVQVLRKKTEITDKDIIAAYNQAKLPVPMNKDGTLDLGKIKKDLSAVYQECLLSVGMKTLLQNYLNWCVNRIDALKGVENERIV